jgi:hypothetical protein
MGQQQPQNITIVQKNEGCLGGCAKWVALLVFLLIIAVAIIVSAVNKGMEQTRAGNKGQGAKPQNAAQTTKTVPRAANPTLQKALAYLPQNVKELAKYKIIGNDVYIAFKGNVLPEDYKIIANAAAVNGSQALVKAGETPSRCTAWILPVEAEAGNVNQIFYTVTARNGKIE